MTALGLLLLLALVAGCSAVERVGQPWWDMRRDSSAQAPDPATTPDAVVQVYAARAVGWKGVMAVHTWIAVKPSGAPAYTRYEVMGWGGGERGIGPPGQPHRARQLLVRQPSRPAG